MFTDKNLGKIGHPILTIFWLHQLVRMLGDWLTKFHLCTLEQGQGSFNGTPLWGDQTHLEVPPYNLIGDQLSDSNVFCNQLWGSTLHGNFEGIPL